MGKESKESHDQKNASQAKTRRRQRRSEEFTPIKKCGLIFILPTLILTLTPLFILFKFIPSNYLLQPHEYPVFQMDKVLPYHGERPTRFLGHDLNITIGPLGSTLIVINPQPVTVSHPSNHFGEWYLENLQWINQSTIEYGAVLFRNFDMVNEVQFDNLIASVHPDMVAEVYLGTTPRKRINGTRFIQSSTEAPKMVSIPTHLELSFTKFPPPRLYFFVQEINPPPGGQAPLTDFKAVAQTIPKALLDKLKTRGLLLERSYYDAREMMVDPLKSKTWQDMFLTDDRDEATKMANEQGFAVSWRGNNIVLTHQVPVTKNHSITGSEFWCNHFNVLHAPTYTIPYLWSAQLMNSRQSLLAALFMELWVQGRNALGYGYGHNALYADDGTNLSWDDAMTIRRVISSNTWIYDYKQYDLIVIDNHRMAHGRMPWHRGKRVVHVSYH